MATKPAQQFEPHIVLDNPGYGHVYALPTRLAAEVLTHLKVLKQEYRDGEMHYTLDDKKRRAADICALNADDMTAIAVATRLKQQQEGEQQ